MQAIKELEWCKKEQVGVVPFEVSGQGGCPWGGAIWAEVEKTVNA